MNARRNIAGLLAFVTLALFGMVQISEAVLSGPMCIRSSSLGSKIHELRLAYDSTPSGLYVVGGTAFVRTPTPLGTIILSYPVFGGASTMEGGDILLGLRVAWVNTGASSTVVQPFDVNIFLDGTATLLTEQVGTSRTTFNALPVTCPLL